MVPKRRSGRKEFDSTYQAALVAPTGAVGRQMGLRH